MKELTKAEEQVMHKLWEMGKTTVKSIVEMMPDPKPAVNTISTIVRILENKGFVDHEKAGKGYVYFAVVSKETYQKAFMKRFMTNYFQNSFKNMVSFFAKEDKMNVEDIEELLNEVKKDLKE
jgi:predicted transcriptional regulator